MDALETVLGDQLDLAELLADANSDPVSFHFAPCSYRLVNAATGELWTQAQTPHIFSIEVRAEKLPSHFGAGGTFRWHKNCVLPRLHVAVTGGDHASLEGAAVLLSAVTVDVLSHQARSVGLEGVSLQPLVNRQCAFSSLAFTTTSYNLPGRPSIHIMASLLLRPSIPLPLPAPAPNGLPMASDLSAQAGQHAVAISTISPAMTVDARKRQSKVQQGSTTHSGKLHLPADGNGTGLGPTGALNGDGSNGNDDGGDPSRELLPFAPDLLEKRLEKVGKETIGRQNIDNSIDGLRAYLSALNIRNKCKHPLFLVLRFDACVGLLYDSATVQNPIDDDGTFFKMMEALTAAERAPPSATGSVTRFAPFVVAVKASHAQHECEHKNCPVKLCTTLSLPHATSLPSTYRMLCDRQVQILRRTYCRLHCSHHGGVMSGVGLPLGGGFGSAIQYSNGKAAMGNLIAPSSHPPPAVCTSCLVPHQEALTISSSAQKHAASLLSTLTELSTSAQFDCPEREWEYGLRVLAEAMSMHCRTKSAAEIIGYMNDESTSASKRHTSTAPAAAAEVGVKQQSPPTSFTTLPAAAMPKRLESYDHEHQVPTVTCEQECHDSVDDLEPMSNAHNHDHTMVAQPLARTASAEIDAYY